MIDNCIAGINNLAQGWLQRRSDGNAVNICLKANT